MSTKDGSLLEKPLKGGKGANDLQLNFEDILALLSKGGIEDVEIFSGDLNDVVIGTVAPSDATFKNVQIGLPGKEDDGNEDRDYILYDPITGILNIYGGLTVSDSTKLGNIIIRENDITAIGGSGDINLIPQTTDNTICRGNIEFNLTNNFKVSSSNETSLISLKNSTFNSKYNSVNISTGTLETQTIQSLIFETNTAILTLADTVNYFVDQEIVISTNSINGVYKIQEIINANTLKVNIFNEFLPIYSGHISLVNTESIYLSVGKNGVVFNDKIPVKFGNEQNVIESNEDKLKISSLNLQLLDPIPSIDLNFESDFGFLVNNKGTNNEKKVFGTKGTIEIEKLKVNYFESLSQSVININSKVQLDELSIGENILIYSSHNNSIFDSTKPIVIKSGISFGEFGNSNGNIIGYNFGDQSGLYGFNGGIYLNATTDFYLTAERFLYVNSTKITLHSNQIVLSQNPLEIKLGGVGNCLHIDNSNLTINLSKIIIPKTSSLILGDSIVSININNEDDFVISLPNNDKNVILNSNVIINGTFLVNGPSSITTSKVTVLEDPLITLAGNSISQDIKSRGFEFNWWFDVNSKKKGFFGFSQQLKTFLLAIDGNVINDVFSFTELGNLLLNSLNAESIKTNIFDCSIINGNPDLELNVNNIYCIGSVRVPIGKFMEIGKSKIISTNVNELTIDTPKLILNQGNFFIGSTQFYLKDLNNFYIKNIQNIHLEAESVNISNRLTFGNTGVSISVETIDQKNNILFTSSFGGDAIFSNKAVLNGGMNMGNSSLTWTTNSELLWKNLLPNADINLFFKGSIFEAEWKGQPIKINYGEQVILDHGMQKQLFLGLFLRSSTNSNSNAAITIGDNGSNILFEEKNSFIVFEDEFKFGKLEKHLVITHFDGTTDNNLMNINKYGQIGINVNSEFIDGLQGLDLESLLYVNGNINAKGLYFSSTEYINLVSNSLNFASSEPIIFDCELIFKKPVYIFDSNIQLQGFENGNFVVNSEVVTLNSNIVNLVDNTFLSLHYNDFSLESETFLRYTNDNLNITNLNGDIIFNPKNSIVLIENKSILLGTNGKISTLDSEIIISTASKITLDANLVCIKNKLIFNENLDSFIKEDLNGLVVSHLDQITLLTKNVLLPIASKLIFGNENTLITSESNALTFSSPILNLSSLNINIFSNSVLNFKESTKLYSLENFFNIESDIPIKFITQDIYIPKTSKILFYTNEEIVETSQFIQVSTDNSMIINLSKEINLNSPIVNIQNKLSFSSNSSLIYYNFPHLYVESQNIKLNCNKLNIPLETEIQFGENKIKCPNKNSLEIISLDLIDLVSNNVRISGNCCK
ncbi:hypothetical protein HK099_005352 [Clydaea vesicula]|uniref:Uncharacterized protein n=1 Tax=Clydaea vesicula TaxID=447962 RepID=A0AAD5TZ67_9FUNG|nr:hypothetical protein HK099_005352 [Clydaea vesicula]